MKYKLAAVVLVLATSFQIEAQTLRSAGSAQGILMGTAMRSRPIQPAEYNQQYVDTVAREYRQLTPEGAMTFSINTRPTKIDFVLNDADDIVEFAQRYNQTVHGAHLVWGNKDVVPDWFEALGPAGKLDAMRTHIRTMMTRYKNRYPGVVKSWNVVNEAVGGGGGVRNSADDPYVAIGGDSNRDAYIYQAFREARSADSTAQLYYNDFDIEKAGVKQDGVYNLIRNLKNRSVPMPINGIGIQTHVSTDKTPPTVTQLRTTIRRFAGLGLKVRFSELSVRIRTNDGGISLAEQATRNEYYRNIVTACVQEPACVAITTWGFTENPKYNFVSTDYPGFVPALPFDANFQKTPVYNVILNALTP